MSKEMRRKKALRLQVKRGGFLVAALASVAVGGLSTVGADEVTSTDTQPSVEVSSTTEKPTESVSSPSESSNSSSSTEGSDSAKPTSEVGSTETINKLEEKPKESEKPSASVSDTTSANSEKPKESTTNGETKPSDTSKEGSESDKKPSTEGSMNGEKEDKGDKPSSDKKEGSEGSSSDADKPSDSKPDVEGKPDKEGESSGSEKEDSKEETPKEETPKEEPKEEDPNETPKETPKEDPKEDDQVEEKKPELKFEDSSKVEQVGQSYLVNSDSRLKVSVSFNKQSVTDLKLIQKLPSGSFEEFDITEVNLLPVNSTLELSYKDAEGKSQTVYLGTIEDKATVTLSVVKADKSTVEVGANLVITGDSLPGTISATSSDGKYKLTGILNSENTYVFDGSVLYSGDYTFSVESGSSSTFGRKLGTVTFDIKGGEQVLPTPTPVPNPTPTPTPTPTPSVDVTPTPNNGGSTNTNTDKPIPNPTPNPTPEPTPTVPSTPNTPNTPNTPVTPTPSVPVETPNTDNQGGGTVIVNPSAPSTDTTNGNTNTPPNNGGKVDIGGVSDKTNYVDSPDKLTVGVSGGSVQKVKATVSSQEGTTELMGRVVNGSFVADSLPEKDGVYTVKVQVTDDKGQVSEKTITYAVNKNGSTYNWLNKEVNGAYYQHLSEDLKLSEHSTTRLDTGKTKFTFTLDGKVVSLDSRQVKVVEKKEDDGSYTYTYTFDKSAFRDNGIWSISVATVDVDGHASSSNASVQFKFVLDNIAPELKIEGILNNGKYDTAKHQFKVLVKDNIGLARVRVLINGKVYEFTRSELEKGEKILDLERSDKPYTIEVEVVDLAGNTTTQKVDGITVTASDIQALLNSDTVKLVLGALGVGAFAGLLAWWGSSVRKRKALEAELERYRIGAHLVTEAEGILSSSGGSSAEDTGLTESATGPVDMETVLAEGVASLGRDTGSIESSGKLSLLGSSEEGTEVLESEHGEETSILETEELESEHGEETTILETEELDADEHTSILTSEDEEVEHTTILDSGEEEHTSLLEDDSEEHTSVLDGEDDEHTSVLDEEETTPLEERTTILDSDSEDK